MAEQSPYSTLQQYHGGTVSSFIPTITYPFYASTSYVQSYIPPYDFDMNHQQQTSGMPPEHDVQIHAPVPTPAYSALLSSMERTDRTPTPQHPVQSLPVPSVGQAIYSSQQSEPLAASGSNSHGYIADDHYVSVQQPTFPTPCELLTELATNERSSSGPRLAAQTHVLEHPDALSGPASSHTSTSASLSAPSSSDADDDECNPAQQKFDPPSSKKPVNQRKARFRAVAENIGFRSTDP